MRTSTLKFLLLILFSFGLNLNAQSKFVINEGSRLVYEVSTDDKTYWFTVDIIKMDNGINFAWSMSSPVNKTGYVNLSGNALKNASKYMNRFSGGNSDLDKESSVFLSEINFNELVSNKPANMDMGEGYSGEWKNHGKDNYTFNWYGSEISPSAYYLTLDGNGVEPGSVVILAEGPEHLILSMDLGWKIQLKDVM